MLYRGPFDPSLTSHLPPTRRTRPCGRYFGGIKLGTGGLVRAYGGVARSCLRLGDFETRQPTVELRVLAPIALAGAVYQAVNRVERVGEEYTETEVIVKVRAGPQEVEEIEKLVRDAR